MRRSPPRGPAFPTIASTRFRTIASTGARLVADFASRNTAETRDRWQTTGEVRQDGTERIIEGTWRADVHVSYPDIHGRTVAEDAFSSGTWSVTRTTP